MLDKDLALLYGVPTKRLNESVKRNILRFPEEFMFVLTKQETDILRSQTATSKWGGQRYRPYVFTEPGIAMLSSVINSETAIQINILIIKTFIRLRQAMASSKEILELFKELERRVDKHDLILGQILESIERMLAIEEKPKNRIGFLT